TKPGSVRRSSTPVACLPHTARHPSLRRNLRCIWESYSAAQKHYHLPEVAGLKNKVVQLRGGAGLRAEPRGGRVRKAGWPERPSTEKQTARSSSGGLRL